MAAAKKKYVWGTKDGQRVRIEAGRAARIRRRIAGQRAEKGGGGEKPGMKPKPKPKKPKPKPKPEQFGPYSGLANERGVSNAVQSVIDSQIAPLAAQRAEVNQQTASNIRANTALTAQTQGTLATLLENARRSGGAMMMTAAQSAAAMRGEQNRAAQELQSAFGNAAMNEQTKAMLAEGFAPTSSQINADAVQNIYGAGLGAQLQQDFFGRAQAVSAVTQQAFNQGQRERQAAAVREIARNIAAARGQAGALRRQFMREDAQFNLERNTADRAFGMQVAQLNAEAQSSAAEAAYKQQQDAINNAEDAAALRIQAARVQASLQGKPNESRYAKYGIRLKAADKVIDGVYDNIRGALATIGTKDADGNTITGADVWKEGGPWRDAFAGLTARGIGANQAALIASDWFGSSFPKSTRKRILKMLLSRGVSKRVAASIANRYFGAPGQPGAETNGDPYTEPAVPDDKAAWAKWMKPFVGKTATLRNPNTGKPMKVQIIGSAFNGNDGKIKFRRWSEKDQRWYVYKDDQGNPWAAGQTGKSPWLAILQAVRL